LAIKVLDGIQAGTVYGDAVTVTERIVIGENHDIISDDIYPRLIESATLKIADTISSKVDQIRRVKIEIPTVVDYSVKSNIEGATVELDGLVIGATPGSFAASPGIHQVRVSRELMTPWVRTVNIFQNQIINATLELSDEGMSRYTTMEKYKTEMEITKKRSESDIEIAKEQSKADAYAKQKISDGEKAKRENSYERFQGAPTTNIIH
jgi:hypothetical protein